MITIKEIIGHTGLTDSYIRRCLRTMPHIFEPMQNRGDKNTLLFDENALTIFDQIKQKRDEGVSLRDIRKHLEKHLDLPSQSSGSLTVQTVNEQGEKIQWMEEKLELFEKLADLQIENERMKNSLRLLPAPDPEAIRESAYLFAKLENITRPKFFKNKEARETWARLRELLGLGSTE